LEKKGPGAVTQNVDFEKGERGKGGDMVRFKKWESRKGRGPILSKKINKMNGLNQGNFKLGGVVWGKKMLYSKGFLRVKSHATLRTSREGTHGKQWSCNGVSRDNREARKRKVGKRKPG